MDEVFNTPFEVSLRMLLVLAFDKSSAKNVDMITTLDFMAAYGRSFGITQYNLHGDNAFNFSEFASRRELTQRALRHLVLNRLVDVHQQDDGFYYTISENGLTLSTKFDSNYAEEYRATMELVLKHIKEKPESEIYAMINHLSTISLQGGR